MTDRLHRAADVAELLGLTAGTVLDWFEAGRLPGFRLGAKGGPVRFKESDVLAWLEGRRVDLAPVRSEA